jgi:hypothetical protein
MKAKNQKEKIEWVSLFAVIVIILSGSLLILHFTETGLEQITGFVIGTPIHFSCWVAATSSECAAHGGISIIHISNYTNAHAELNNQSNYALTICCNNTNSNLTTDCSGAETILKLSGQTNAHAQLGNITGADEYNHSVCLKTENPANALNCEFRQADCLINETCIVKLSNSTNAHLEDCSNANYSHRICCELILIADLVPPVFNASETLPVNGTIYNQSDIIPLQVSLDENVTVTALIDYPNSTSEILNLNYTGTNWYYNATFINTYPVGRYNITFNATDTSGNSNTIRTYFIVQDITPPVIIIKQPPFDNVNYFNNSVINITVNATDPYYDNIGTVLANITWNSYHKTIILSEIGNTQIFNASFSNTTFIGQYTITIIANDTFGNVNTSIRLFNITIIPDTAPPGFNTSQTLPLVNSTYNQSNIVPFQVLINENAVVAANISYPNGTIEIISLNHNGTDWCYKANFTSTYPIGRYNVTFTATDFSLNKNTTQTYFTVQDITPPSVKVIAPVNDSYYFDNTIIAVTANATDPYYDNIGTVLANITWNSDYQIVNLTLLFAGQYTGNFYNTSNLTRYNVTITARDTSGNINTAKAWFNVRSVLNCTLIGFSYLINTICQDSIIINSTKTDSVIFNSTNKNCTVMDSFEEKVNCVNSTLESSVLKNTVCNNSDVIDSIKYNSTIVNSTIINSINYNCTIINTTEINIVCYDAEIINGCIASGSIYYPPHNRNYSAGICLPDLYEGCIFIGTNIFENSTCISSVLINSTKKDNSTIINSTNDNCSVSNSFENRVDCTDSGLSGNELDLCTVINSTLTDVICKESVIISSSKQRVRNITDSYNYNCEVNGSYYGLYYVNEYNVECADSIIKGDSNLKDSKIINSWIYNVDASNNSVINNSLLSNCTVINSTVKNYRGSNCHILNTIIDPPGPFYNLNGSNITDSEVFFSNVTFSKVNNSIIWYSDINDSNISSSNLTNCNVSSSVIINSIKLNSTIINSLINNSNNTNCDIINNTEIGIYCRNNYWCKNSICEGTNDTLGECNFCAADCNISACCGNGICDIAVGENETSCSQDCAAPVPPSPPPSAPSRAPSVGGGFLTACYENWNCTEWGSCQPNGTQTRECHDINSCDVKYNERIVDRVYTKKKPETMQNCIYIAPETCYDRIKNQDETDIDCGGNICRGCADGRRCLTDRDCINRCDATIGTCYTPAIPVLEAPKKQGLFDILSAFLAKNWSIIISLILISAAVAAGAYTYRNLDKFAFYQNYMARKQSKFIAAGKKAEEEKQKLFELQRKRREAVMELRRRIRREYAERLDSFLEEAVKKGHKKQAIISVLVEKGWPAHFAAKYVENYFRRLHAKFEKLEIPMEQTEEYAMLQEELENINKKLAQK